MKNLEYIAYPTCPHCGEKVERYWDVITEYTEDEDQIEYECEGCGGSVAVIVHIEYSFSTIQ